LPGYRVVKDPYPLDYGITKMDHVVGNVWNMDKTINNLKKALGLHTFAKVFIIYFRFIFHSCRILTCIQFSQEEIQTPWTSLNSEVLSSNNERVLFPVNEPAPGKKESQITEYLKAYNGPGVQRINLIKSPSSSLHLLPVLYSSHFPFSLYL
jgi:4-hydroxyphenylpyruvate dioxygenase